MKISSFADIITSEAELRTLIGQPAELIKQKKLNELDIHAVEFIARSPLLFIGTRDDRGCCDVSPRGDPPGFVRILDNKHLVIPERPGNRLADSLCNIIETGAVGLLFVIPGVEDIFRINGRACITRTPELLQSMSVQEKVPLIAIGIEIEECYFHCAKAIKRSRLWDTASWKDSGDLPSLAKVIMDQTKSTDITIEELEETIKESYATRLY